MTQVVKATGFDVSKMKATTGLNQSKIKGNFKNRVGQNLQSEEEGGTVTNTKILPLDNARLGRSLKGKVRRGMFKNDISFHDATDSFKRKPKSGSGSKKAAFIRAMHATLKAGKKQMLIRGSKGRLTGYIYDINYSSNLKSKSTKIKASLVYGLRPKRTHTSKRYAFVEDARKIVLKDIQKIYNNNADFQIKKYLK
jgi:hypothetical protein